MAGLGRKEWSPGDVLTASDVNGYLMDQSVMVFAGTAERGSAIPSPSAGMVAYSTATGLQVYNGSTFDNVGGKLLQVVSTAKTDTFTTSSATMTDVTGLSVAITPSSATSKVLVIVQLWGNGTNGTTNFYGNLVRGATAIDIGAAAGSRSTVTFFAEASATGLYCMSSTFLDSPATTSATTYKIQVRNQGSGTVYVNRRETDDDSATRPRLASTITVMEISA